MIIYSIINHFFSSFRSRKNLWEFLENRSKRKNKSIFGTDDQSIQKNTHSFQDLLKRT